METIHDLFNSGFVDIRDLGGAVDDLACTDRSRTAKHHQIDQRVGAETVGTMY